MITSTSSSNMAPQTTNVTIELEKEDTQPPIYLAGSFSDPAWHPQEMEYTVHENLYRYHKDVQVEEGKQYQYKFRVGPGDWWILNEEAPTVTDDAGNRNNLLEVPVPKKPSGFDDEQKPTSVSENNASTAPTKILSNTTDAKHKSSRDSQPQGDVPTLTVEKTDTKLSYGDDFGENATVGQKEAHAMRAQDAEPDLVLVKQDRQASEVAAEVADSAQLLDREVPTPPVSDAEAGRIGLRRMSQTPIPEVANTAAEVGDSAARLDGEQVSHIDLPSRQPLDGSTGSDATTPWEERAPLFAHECLEPPEDSESPSTRRDPSPEKRQQEHDPEDPSIEEFPQDQRLIMEQFRAMEARLKEDEDTFDGVPPSPVVGADRSPSYSDLPTPSPGLLARDQSPSLGSIPEERSSRPVLSSLPGASLPDKKNSSFSRRYSNDSSANGRRSRLSRSRESDSSLEQDKDQPATATSTSPDSKGKDKAEAVAEQSPPDVKIQAASPASSTRVDSAEGQDTATTTGVASDPQSQLKSRNQQPSPLADRPTTPHSVHSSTQDVKSKNYLKIFFKTVFVDWLGGLILRLFGSRRRQD